MDLHPDLQRWRVAQGVLRGEEVRDRVMDRVNAGFRRVSDTVDARNATQLGIHVPTQLRTQFYLGDDRIQTEVSSGLAIKRESDLMPSQSGSVLNMYEWHRGAGNTDLHSYITAHNDFARQFQVQFSKAPEIIPYADELNVPDVAPTQPPAGPPPPQPPAQTPQPIPQPPEQPPEQPIPAGVQQPPGGAPQVPPPPPPEEPYQGGYGGVPGMFDLNRDYAGAAPEEEGEGDATGLGAVASQLMEQAPIQEARQVEPTLGLSRRQVVVRNPD